MGLKLTSIGSSSSGNSYIIQSGETALILDTGLSGKKIRTAIAELGLSEKDIRGILITHEHTDHVNSVRLMSKVCDRAKVYASRGTAFNSSAFAKIDAQRIEYIVPGDSFEIGDIAVQSFALSHDAAEPTGYSFANGDDMMSVVTDTGVVTDEIYEQMIQSNMLVFEANHEEGLLMVGPYPYSVKRRILSDYGHLSNVSSGECLRRLLEERESDAALKILLAHLSSQNNTPGQAVFTVEEEIKRGGFERGVDYTMEVALKEGLTVFE
ncbi:MAG: MBL fold metallo-hydrolase [Firmicutes bacterium]|nr:MBL fold metallo-hydrolase [Bacillota bacterium]